MPTLERGVDQFLETSLAEVLNPTWHSAAGVVCMGQLNCHHGRDVGVICQGIFEVSSANSYQLPILSTSETLDITVNE